MRGPAPQQGAALSRQTALLPGSIAVVLVVLDQLTKAWIWNFFGGLESASVPLVGSWLRFTLVYNTGVAFSLFKDIPYLFTIMPVLISIGAVYFYLYHLPNHRTLIQICVGMIIGGAIGNIIDRLRLGFVIDFIHVTWFPGIFNLADSAITVGVILLAGYLLIVGEETPRRAAADEALLGE